MQIVGNKLIADDGMRLTNGEIVVSVVYLACDATLDDWREVTESEAETIQRDSMEAEVEDYQRALNEMGVDV